MSNVEVAVSLFEEGSLCSQAVLTAWEQELGLDRETALKVSGNNIFTVCPECSGDSRTNYFY